jgi:hypothetical protein
VASLADYDNPFVWLIKAGDDSRMTAMLADPILVNFKPCHAFQTRTAPEKGPLLSVPYKMPAEGELTLGLYDKDGHLLRWLIQCDHRNVGENTEPWDGLDQYGNPVAPGNYILKAIYHASITTDYKMSVCNPGNPPWPTAARSPRLSARICFRREALKIPACIWRRTRTRVGTSTRL